MAGLLGLAACAAPVAVAPAPPAPVAPADPKSEATGIPAGYVDLHATKIGQPDPNNAVVLLEGDGSSFVVPVYIGVLEANAIGLRLLGRESSRPLTADLLEHVMHELHGTLVKVQIDDLHDGIYFGSVFVRDEHRRVIRIDARPSDALALGIGGHVPIYVAQKVIDVAGKPREMAPALLRGASDP